jgi:integrase/recombinase XerD
LYSPGEITALMAAAGKLVPPLRAATWQTLIGLLAVTGMRKSEACHLDREQVNLAAGVLTITDAKFGKARQLFLHPTAVAALRGYQRRRDRWCPELYRSSGGSARMRCLSWPIRYCARAARCGSWRRCR